MKTCEICDRPIKTGRKYCWEHRHTAQAEAIRGDKTINEAAQAYLEYHTENDHQILKRNRKVIISVLIVYYLLLIGMTLLFGYLLGESSKFPIYFFYIGVFIGSIIAAILPYKYRVIPNKTLSDDITNRDPEYVKWVKEWVKNEKEEKEFRKSLLK